MDQFIHLPEAPIVGLEKRKRHTCIVLDENVLNYFLEVQQTLDPETLAG